MRASPCYGAHHKLLPGWPDAKARPRDESWCGSQQRFNEGRIIADFPKRKSYPPHAFGNKAGGQGRLRRRVPEAPAEEGIGASRTASGDRWMPLTARRPKAPTNTPSPGGTTGLPLAAQGRVCGGMRPGKWATGCIRPQSRGPGQGKALGDRGAGITMRFEGLGFVTHTAQPLAARLGFANGASARSGVQGRRCFPHGGFWRRGAVGGAGQRHPGMTAPHWW